eukprot:5760357-Pleurochrysis_carterae.AAC.1
MTEAAHARLPASPACDLRAASLAVVPTVASLPCAPLTGGGGGAVLPPPSRLDPAPAGVLAARVSTSPTRRAAAPHPVGARPPHSSPGPPARSSRARQ